MLLSQRKITRDLIGLILSWRHSGLQVYVGPRLQPGEEEATEDLARYIILKHLGLLEMKVRSPPEVKVPSVSIYLDYLESQISSPDSFYMYPEYPMYSCMS
jgi:hypothetical protein